MVSKISRTLLLIALVAGCLLAITGIVNGNFNTGNLSGWSSAGWANVVGPQGSVIPPSGAAHQALIASGDEYTGIAVGDLESNLNLPAHAIHAALPNNGDPTVGSAIWQTFTATAGSSVSFNWNFATNEEIPTDYDAALYTLRAGSSPAQAFELADTSQSSVVNHSASGSPFETMTGYRTVTIPITTTGTYTIGFVSMQTEDDEVESGTYITNVTVGATAVVPTMSMRGLSILGVLLMVTSALLLRKSHGYRTS